MIQAFKNEAARQRIWASYDQLLKYWDADYQEDDVTTPYGSTHTIIAGSPELPPLMLLHGVGDNSAVMWALNIKVLSQYFYCIAVDTLGGPGKSIPNANFMKGKFDTVHWLTSIVDHYGYDQVHVAGVSNGASMAYQFTVNAPERVRKTVCMEGGMIIHPMRTMWRTLKIMFPEILMPTHKQLRKIIGKLSSPDTDVYDRHPHLADHVIALMQAHNRKAMFVHKVPTYIRKQGLAVQDKLLFLLGDHTLDVNAEMLETLRQDYYQFRVIASCGHGINHEQPEHVHRELLCFLLGINEENTIN